MKENYINSIGLLIIMMLAIAGCNEKPATTDAHKGHQFNVDTSVDHLLKPVNEKVVSNIPVVSAVKGPKILTETVPGIIDFDSRNTITLSSRVSGRIERMRVRFNYQPVSKGELLMEIYSPDLVATQRELLYLVKSGSDERLVKSAKEKLSLLGMTYSQINAVITKGQPQYRIGVYSPATGYILESNSAGPARNEVVISGQGNNGMEGMGDDVVDIGGVSSIAPDLFRNTPILTKEGEYLAAGEPVFNIYQNHGLIARFSFNNQLASYIHKNRKMMIWALSDSLNTHMVKVGFVEPVVLNGRSFSEVRVYMDKKDFRPGQIMTALIAYTVNDGWWLPRKAVWDLGDRQVIFHKEGNVFLPKEIRTGVKDDEWVQILDDISSLRISSNAWFLVDSESFIPTIENNN